MNAGAHGSDVSRIFKSADIVLETGNWLRMLRKIWRLITDTPFCMNEKGL